MFHKSIGSKRSSNITFHRHLDRPRNHPHFEWIQFHLYGMHLKISVLRRQPDERLADKLVIH